MTIPLAIVRTRPRHVGTRIIDAVRYWWRLLARPRTLRPRLWVDTPPQATMAAMLCAVAHHGRALRRLDTPDASRPTFISGGAPHAGAVDAGTTRRRPPPALPSPSDGTPESR